MSLDNVSLIADVGGTNARFALVEVGSLNPTLVVNLAVEDFPNIDDAIEAYLKQIGSDVPERVCIAIACPTHLDMISMTNSGWKFSKSDWQQCAGACLYCNCLSYPSGHD